MTQQEFEQELYYTLELALTIMMANAPVRSGFLREHIFLKATSTGYKIYVDPIVFYMPYTEEAWISPRWKGRANPNEGWFKDAVDMVWSLLRTRLGGTGMYIGNVGSD